MIIGIIGLVLLAIAWIFEIISVMKYKRKRLDLKFALLYVIGTLCLVIYAIQIKDPIFIILNSMILVLSLVSLVYVKDK